MSDFLTSELAAVRSELTRIDSKCSTLTGLAGAALAFLVTRVSHEPIVARILLGAAGIALALSTGMLLSVLRPRLGSTGFRKYADMTVDSITLVPAVNGFKADRVVAEDLQVLSQIVSRKYRAFRVAADLTVAAVALIAAALMAGVIA